MNLDFCDCVHYRRSNQKFLTNHHPSCLKYDPEGDAHLIIKDLLEAMRIWGNEEDGIPDFAEKAYNKAAVSIYHNPLPINEYSTKE